MCVCVCVHACVHACVRVCVHACRLVNSHECMCMGGSGTVLAIAGFQHPVSERNKNGAEMHFVCDFSDFRIQTIILSHPCMCVVTMFSNS